MAINHPELGVLPCPDCHADRMFHRCVTPVSGEAGFRLNGWYCELCNAGPYRLGNVSEQVAAATAVSLVFRAYLFSSLTEKACAPAISAQLAVDLLDTDA